jgi:hypothetical protein
MAQCASLSRQSFILLMLILPFLSHARAAEARWSAEQATDQTIPVIARDAGKAIVLVVASNCSGDQVTQGSGFVISSDGRVATNFHVIRGCSSAIIKFADGSFYQVAGVLATDATKDIAILKIAASGKEFPFLVMADSDQVQVGEHVVAIGSPLALQGLTGSAEISTESTVSDGIISGKRDWEGHGISLLQTTAPVSHGSSGGALLNMRGQVLGITTMAIGQGQNLNFAVPAKYVTSMSSMETLKPLGSTEAINSHQERQENSIDQFNGTYTGIWQSRYGSGIAVLHVRTVSGSLKADVAITGSPVGYRGDSLLVTVKDFGDGVLNVEMRAENSPLSASGVFRNGAFVGDYSFKFRKGVDRGQWTLKK